MQNDKLLKLTFVTCFSEKKREKKVLLIRKLARCFGRPTALIGNSVFCTNAARIYNTLDVCEKLPPRFVMRKRFLLCKFTYNLHGAMLILRAANQADETQK